MDQYKASIDSVDSALARLNQTLQSYSLFASKTKNSSNANPPKEESRPLKSVPQQSEPVPESPERDAIDPSEDVHARSEIRKQILGLRSSIKYPEVCTQPERPTTYAWLHCDIVFCAGRTDRAIDHELRHHTRNALEQT
jgi:hypothetical protein